jgi:hypothetical protein
MTIIASVLLFWTQIPFCMALSTFFKDSKVAQGIGQLVMMIPIIILLNLLISEDRTVNNCLYPCMIFPAVPAITLIMHYVN